MDDFEPMSKDKLIEMEDIVKRSAQLNAGHRHWFPNVYADLLCREIRRCWAEQQAEEEMKKHWIDWEVAGVDKKKNREHE